MASIGFCFDTILLAASVERFAHTLLVDRKWISFAPRKLVDAV